MIKPKQDWEVHEEECFEYLKEINSSNNRVVSFAGKKNSRVSDIKVEDIDKMKETYYIEAKMKKSQSGQFVLLPDIETKKFIFSPRNEFEEDEASKNLIEYMNKHFDYFSEAGTSGKELSVDSTLCSEWIISHYKKKGAKFFITKVDDRFFVSLVDNVNENYDIKGVYRVKGSGSHEPPKKNEEEIENILKRNSIEYKELYREGKKLFVRIKGNLSDKKQLEGEDNRYQFNQVGNNTFEIRALAKTRNPNVIFELKLKKNILGQDDKEILKFLEENE